MEEVAVGLVVGQVGGPQDAVGVFFGVVLGVVAVYVGVVSVGTYCIDFDCRLFCG